jgi:ferredoxin
MAKLVFVDSQEVIEVGDGQPIAEACEQAGVPIACSEGVCGTCVIDVVDGMENLSDFTEAEADFLGESNGERLACQCRVNRGTVKIKF